MRYRILGSCVTRDAFEFSDNPALELERYFARSSVASAFAGPQFEGVETELIPSAFQRRIVEWDLQKEFAKSLPSGAFDFVIIDLIDERFDLLRAEGGRLATRSNEFRRAGDTSERYELIASGSPEFLELWTAGWRAFMELVDRTIGRESVVLHRAWWAERTESGQQFKGQTAASIARANAFLAELYGIIAKDLPKTQILTPPADLVVGADEHKWGPSPFHYTTEYYESFLRLLTDACERKS
jgi:hypothetical protein